MSNDKVIEELLSRIQALEEKVEALSPKTNAKEPAGDKEKRCLPGYNSCDIN